MGFVACRRRDLTNAVDPVRAGHPLIGLELYLADKVMQMCEEGGEDLLGAGRGILAGGANDILCELLVVLCVVGHCDGGGGGNLEGIGIEIDG